MRNSIRSATFAAFLALVPPALHAQQGGPARGRVVGKILDGTSGQGVTDATIQVDGSTLVAQSGVDGRFALGGVPAGTVTLNVRRVGYSAKSVTGVQIDGGRTVSQDITLVEATFKLSTVQVTAEAEKGTVSQALDQQKNAISVVSAITQEQIAKSPDGNAAATIQRVSGVTVQDGKYVFVRGLGERYTTSSLNGARVPSPEPERRVVPLDMFPSGLLQSITTTKTFTPDQQGDFSGALVDIRTREFPTLRTMALQVGSGYAMGATGSSLFAGTTVGGEHWASVGSARALPAAIAAVRDFPHANLTQADNNQLINQFRDSWTPLASTGAPLLNGSASFGGNDPILFGHRLGYLLSGSVSSSVETKDKEVRSLAQAGSTPGTTEELGRFDGSSVTQSVLWGGMTNLSTYVGTATHLSFNGLYNRSGDNEARVERGTLPYEGIPVKYMGMDYTQRAVYSGQLAGEHQINERNRFDWSATTSGVRRYEPDRSEFLQAVEHDTPGGPEVLRWVTGGSGGAVRTFSDLNESSHEYQGSYRLDVGPETAPTMIKIGGLYRTTSRDASTSSFAIFATGMSDAERALPPEQIFDGRFTSDTSSTRLTLGPLSQGGSYTARDNLRAGFAMAEVPVGSSVHVLGGARYESDRVEVDAASTLGTPVRTTREWNDVLPALAVNVKFTDKHRLRLSASRTLARPEYRELSPITSRDIVGGENLQGDDQLERTNVTNVDLRYEMYPGTGEVFSVALFGKKFQNPIEQVYGSGSGGTSYVFFSNAESADNYGVEVEARKDLYRLGRFFDPYTVFANVTVMESRIHLGNVENSAATNVNRRMVGQAPYVINTGITYTSHRGTSTATILFNRVGERITAAGSRPLPDVIETPRNVLDASFRLALTNEVTLRADAKNILDAPHQLRQGNTVRESYVSGSTYQMGLAWRP